MSHHALPELLCSLVLFVAAGRGVYLYSRTRSTTLLFFVAYSAVQAGGLLLQATRLSPEGAVWAQWTVFVVHVVLTLLFLFFTWGTVQGSPRTELELLAAEMERVRAGAAAAEAEREADHEDFARYLATSNTSRVRQILRGVSRA